MAAPQIRRVVPEDLPHLEDLFLTCFNAPPWNDGWSREAVHERLGDLLAARHSRGLIAFMGSDVVGMLIGQMERWVDAYHFNLIEMCVLPSNQRAGVGRALVGCLFQELGRDGARKVHLITAPEGPAAAFYSELGFYVSRGRIVMARNLGS
jgi:aminoglycoside 6'-N-acetyltransferase I